VKRCPSCELENHDDAAFCIRCGFALGGVVADGKQSESPPGQRASRYLPTGALIDGKYEIDKILGEGGMGVVYLARDVHTETPVVVKSIRAEFAHNPEFRARTLAEGRALARIDHPNVVRLNAVVVEPAALYLVMQYIDGEPLDQMIERHVATRTPLPIALALSIFRMILRGVGAAHAEGLIHRDLKPANILIRRKDGVAKVTDFGIAKAEDDAKAGRGVTKGIIGSLAYMAPEQVRGQKDLDKRVDIYALGILLFELVMGRAPFEAASDYELMRMQAEAPIPGVAAQRPDAPPYLDEILIGACAKERDHRFASTDEFLAALDAAERLGFAPVAHSPIAPGFTVRAPAPPVMTTPPSAQPWPVDSHHVGVTGEGASLPPGPRVGARRRGPWIWASVGAIAVAAGSTAVYLGSNQETPNSTPLSHGAPDASARPALSARLDVMAPTPPSPLAALVGNWRSASGRDFTAALASDDSLEFRVVHASQHPRQGYEDGDVRFRLMATVGSPNEFAVEDHLRPTPPPGFEYDPKTSRESCVGIWTAVKGHKLLAQFDGANSLTTDFVQIRTGPEKFKTQGKRVIGCVDLISSPAEPIESKLSRTP